MDFKEIFDKWISKKVDFQIFEIDKIAKSLDINTKDWFNHYLSRSSGDYTGVDILNELLSNFTFDISRKFEKLLCKYLPPAGFNIHNEPYLGFFINYDIKYGFFLTKGNKRHIKILLKKLNISQKEELLKNKLFLYIIKETKLKIFSKKEIRFLKLKNINEYSSIIA
jgi:hypothetical protein